MCGRLFREYSIIISLRIAKFVDGQVLEKMDLPGNNALLCIGFFTTTDIHVEMLGQKILCSTNIGKVS